MSRFITKQEDGSYLIEIDDMKMCKWLYNEICTNDKCPDLADYPYPYKKCYEDNIFKCEYFEKEDGKVE